MGIRHAWDEENNTWDISLSGEIDIYNASQLKSDFSELINRKQGNFAIDCADLKYLDSTGLGVLISLLRRVGDYDGKIEINNLKPHIHKIFTITGLDKMFTIQVQE